MTTTQTRRLPGLAATLLLGLGAGWLAANPRGPTLKAMTGGVDRFGDYAATSVTVATADDEATKAQASKEAVVFLDYKGGRLLATIPSYKQTVTRTQIIDGFAERDLAADFRLDDRSTPHFVMTAASIGDKSVRWTPLFVFETATRQVAVYRIEAGSQTPGSRPKPRFDLLEVRSIAGDAPLPDLPAESGPAAGRR